MPPPSTESCSEGTVKVHCVWEYIDCVAGEDAQTDTEDTTDEVKFSLVEGSEDWLVPDDHNLTVNQGERTLPLTDAEKDLWEHCMVEGQEKSFDLELREYDGANFDALGCYTVYVKLKNGKPVISNFAFCGKPLRIVNSNEAILPFKHGYDYEVKIVVHL